MFNRSLARSGLALALALLSVRALVAAESTPAGTLVSGPMLGYRAHREVLIWVETRDAAEVSLTYQLADTVEATGLTPVSPAKPTASGLSVVPTPSAVAPVMTAPVTLTHLAPAASPAGTQPQKFVLPLLEMGRRYTYSIAIDGREQSFPYPLEFRTTDQWEWRRPAPEFSFLFGSCAYLNDPAYDRPGKPYGQGTEIFKHMADSGADFCLWGGDNIYLREADFSSESGIWYRFSHDRATSDLQKLYAVMHHYATWDDHDYGSDNANQSFGFKDITLAAFKSYWGNPTYGETTNPGVYTKFIWGDAGFFLMDDRTYRDESSMDQDKNLGKTAWGDRQINWLKQSLLYAQTQQNQRFKFIITGGQVLQTMDKKAGHETSEFYRREREELIGFIRENKISGVVFLTGDVHHSALYRRALDEDKTRFIYELTSSPLSAGSWAAAASEKASDPAVIPGTVVGTQNYCVIKLTGTKETRALAIRCYDKANALQWEQTVPASALEPASTPPAQPVQPPASTAPAAAN
jgi:alkaline phosphatase D